MEQRSWLGGDYELTVTGRTELTRHYLRLHFSAPALLAERRLQPTMCVRGWFPDGQQLHQRGYALLNADVAAGTVDIDFAMHEGPASRWAAAAKAGDVLQVTVPGGDFQLPQPRPAGYVIVGDTASLPAINTLLEAIDDDIPARVFLEARHDDDRDLPVAGDVDLTWVPATTRIWCGLWNHRRSTPPATSAGSRATTARRARSPVCSASGTASRAAR